MTAEPINEREFELINIVGAELADNQRDLSRRMELSLGTVNMLLRRLVQKGYIRIHQLNKKKVQYILTPKGMTEKMRKSVKYTLKTINSIGLIKKAIKEVLLPSYQQGERIFYVLGESDLALLIEMVLKEFATDGYKVIYLKDLPKEHLEGVILVCREETPLSSNGNKYIDLIHELSVDHTLMTQNIN
jgi:DNA-binding MarR family transcriptional regulator